MSELLEFGAVLSGVLAVKLFQLHGVTVTIGNLAVFLITFLVSLLLGRIASTALVKILERRGGTASSGLAYSLGRIAQYTVTVIGVMIAFETVGFSLSTLAALGAVLAVGLGFGLQNITQNFISGLILLLERPIKKGDVVIVDGVYGVVDEIAIRATRIMTFDDIALIVPNSKLISDTVENRSEPTMHFRLRIDVGVAYGSDTRLVEHTLLGVARQNAEVLAEPEPVVFFREFGDSSLDFQLCIWLGDPLAGLSVSSELRHAIVKAFEEAGITIPFPQRDVHLYRSEPERRDG